MNEIIKVAYSSTATAQYQAVWFMVYLSFSTVTASIECCLPNNIQTLSAPNCKSISAVLFPQFTSAASKDNEAEDAMIRLESKLKACGLYFHVFFMHMDVSENSDIPKSSISIGVFHDFHHPFSGPIPIFWKHPSSAKKPWKKNTAPIAWLVKDKNRGSSCANGGQLTSRTEFQLRDQLETLSLRASLINALSIINSFWFAPSCTIVIIVPTHIRKGQSFLEHCTWD